MCRLDHPLILDPVAPPAGPGGLGVEHGEAGAGANRVDKVDVRKGCCGKAVFVNLEPVGEDGVNGEMSRTSQMILYGKFEPLKLNF